MRSSDFFELGVQNRRLSSSSEGPYRLGDVPPLDLVSPERAVPMGGKDVYFLKPLKPGVEAQVYLARVEAEQGTTERVLKVFRAVQGPESTSSPAQRESEILEAIRKVSPESVIGSHGAENVTFVQDSRSVLILDAAKGDLQSASTHLNQLSHAQQVRLVEQMLSSLQAVHGAGYVHGDLHAGNFLITQEGRAVLTDFGQAQQLSNLLGDEQRRTLLNSDRVQLGRLIETVFSESILKDVGRNLQRQGTLEGSLSKVRWVQEALNREVTTEVRPVVDVLFPNEVAPSQARALQRKGNFGAFNPNAGVQSATVAAAPETHALDGLKSRVALVPPSGLLTQPRNMRVPLPPGPDSDGKSPKITSSKTQANRLKAFRQWIARKIKI